MVSRENFIKEICKDISLERDFAFLAVPSSFEEEALGGRSLSNLNFKRVNF